VLLKGEMILGANAVAKSRFYQDEPTIEIVK
jgi:hypothetical protein